jgi:histidyl-tRNA synthetase
MAWIPTPFLIDRRTSMSNVLPVKGTRDFYPQEMAFRTWLYDNIRQVSESFGYQEYEAPFLERLELYAAKSGEELVKEQSYVFKDRSDDWIALRPELTPSLARMVAQISKSMTVPLRWWSFGPFWRYERPQKGRTREFFQWNIDLLGMDSPEVDAELGAVAATLFQRIGLTPDKVRIKVNDRQLVEKQLEGLGIDSAQFQTIFKLIDRRDKMSSQDWAKYAGDEGLADTIIQDLQVLIDDEDGWKQSQELVGFFNGVEALGVSEYFEYDPEIIRGLDYYTGIVFEARDPAGNFRAIIGGGRYDSLVADVGGEPVPATGFAMGDVVIQLVLEAAGVEIDLNPNPAQVFMTTFDESTRLASMNLTRELRQAGLRVEWYPEPERLSKQFKYADKQGIPLAIILGPEEIAQDQVAIKDLRSGDQIAVPTIQVAQQIETLLTA